MEADFGGYATRAGVKCTDGRTITAEAFAHMDKMQIPIVWSHDHTKASSVLGHTILEARPDGMYAFGFFNDSVEGKAGKIAVEHGDINSLSIWANQLKETNLIVHGGQIREVSLVHAGANPGAKIDFIRLSHSDDPSVVEYLDDEAVISMGQGLELKHAATKAEPASASDTEDDSDDGETIADIYNTFTPKQRDVVNYMLTVAAQGPDDSGDEAQHSDDDEEDEALIHQEGNGTVTNNVFEDAAKKNKSGGNDAGDRHFVSHTAMRGILDDVRRTGTFTQAVNNYMMAHNISNIEALFPDPKTIGDGTPQFNARATAWVQGVIDGTRKNPFARIKAVVADLTQDEARARGYIKGNYKKEEWFAVTTRSTTPTTIYKKQKVDRNDILDITGFDMISWLKAEMRLMLMEEIAVAILIGDGREVDDIDKIKDPMGGASGEGVRSIMNENELYATQVNVDVSGTDTSVIVDQIMSASEFYKGSGSPTFYATQRTINQLLLSKDANLHRNYDNPAALAAALNVAEVVPVEPMNRFPNLIGIVINMNDYVVGTDNGGQIMDFDLFDIDYNQQKYLLETRMSGAIVRIKSALVINKATSGATLVATPTAPSFVGSTGVVTIPTQTGVVYKDFTTGVVGSTLSAGAQTALGNGVTQTIKAVPATGYYFEFVGINLVDEWTFTGPRS